MYIDDMGRAAGALPVQSGPDFDERAESVVECTKSSAAAQRPCAYIGVATGDTIRGA